MSHLYRLSPFFELIEENNATPKLYDKKTSEVLIINETIYSFLKIFKQPTTVQGAVTFFKNNIQGEKKEVVQIVKDFFNSMLNRGIIVHNTDWNLLRNRPFAPNYVGEKFDNYHIQKRLSENPPVSIYLATDSLQKKYILKKYDFPDDIPKSYLQKEKRLFFHEFKIMKKLRGCPQVAQLVSVNKENDYAVIEYFDGMSLRKRIEENQPKLTNAEKKYIFSQVLQTLAYVHNHKILHGDLHYSNILINNKNEIKLIDFDLGLYADKYTNVHSAIGGVKDFLPPERIDTNAFDVFKSFPDYKSEVFQIGIIGYFIYNETLPFQGDTWRSLAHSIINSEPEWKDYNIPYLIKDLITKSMSKNPDKRFDSAQEMYDTLTSMINTDEII